MASIVSNFSSLICNLSKNTYSFLGAIFTANNKTSSKAVKLANQNISGQNADLARVKENAGNLSFNNSSLNNHVYNLVEAEEFTDLERGLLSKLSEKVRFIVAKKITKKTGYFAKAWLLTHIDLFKLSEDQRFFIARRVLNPKAITPDFISAYREAFKPEKFHLSYQKTLAIAKKFLNSAVFKTFNRISALKILRELELSTLTKEEFQEYLSTIVKLLESEKGILGNYPLDEVVQKEISEKIRYELLKSKKGIEILTENVGDFTSWFNALSLEKREEITYFLLNNNHREALLKILPFITIGADLQMKIINVCLQKKKTRETLLTFVLPILIRKGGNFKDIYKKYFALELQPPKILGKFFSDIIFGESTFFIHNGQIPLESKILISAYCNYFSQALSLDKQQQEKFSKIFDEFASFISINTEHTATFLFQAMILFFSRLTLAKKTDLNFLDDKNFFINMLLSLSEINPDVKDTFLKFLEKHKKTLLKDSRNFEPLMALLSGLCKLHLEKHMAIDPLINQIIDPSGKEPPEMRFRMISACLNFGLLEQINQAGYLSSNSLIKILTKKLFAELDIFPNIQSFEKKILKKLRDPVTLFTYLGNILTLDKDDQAKMKAALKAIIVAMLNDSMNAYRKESPHLNEILKEDQKYRVLIEEWLKERNLEIKAFEANERELKPQNILFFDFIKLQLIAGKHLENLESLFPNLATILKSDFNQEAFDSALNTLKQKIQVEISRKNYKALINLKAEYALINACTSPKASLDETLRLLKIALPDKDAKKSQFILDIEDFIKKQIKKDESLKDYFFSVSSNLSDLLLLGMETGGCQNIDVNPSLNKHLLGYLDGKAQIWAIKNKQGQTVARAIAKLLWSKERKTPVIFLEKVYSLNPSEIFKNALLQHAKNLAKDLKLPLFMSGQQQEELVSYGSISPFEYSDGVLLFPQTNGKYSINSVELLYAPPAS